MSWLTIGCDSDVGEPDAGDDAGSTCASDVDCSDELFCNGVERCQPTEPGADAQGCVAGLSPCDAEQICDEDDASCTTDACEEPDADGDGFDRPACGGADCDDGNAGIYPGNAEVCDPAGQDEDCDPSTLGHDMDEDGFVDAECCNGLGAARTCGRDCDDSMSTVSPSATESCNRVDEDCDGNVDEGTLSTYYQDMDGDDFGRADVTMEGCVRPAGYADTDGDCDDTDVGVFPGATEVCNDEDTDCNGTPDDRTLPCACTIGTPPRDCGTPDGSGGIETRGACTVGTQRCDGVWGPCEDAVLATAETCDGVNEDCDDAIDEEATDRVAYYLDGDSDGFGDMSMVTLACPTDMPANHVTGPRFDCDDDDPSRDPDETETCDGVDEDCDITVDEAPGVESCGAMAGVSYACMSGGMCAITGCPAGRDDCNDDHLDGCEVTLTDNDDHCGACDVRCDLDCASTACDDIVVVDAGRQHACGIRQSGGLVCWGDNDRGQLGDGTVIRRPDPREVAVVASVVRVSAGITHSCAVQADGRAFCWGANDRGQVGRPGSASPEQVPREVSLTGVTDIAAGNEFSCAVTGGALYCWGRNNLGQLGDGGTSDTHLPRPVRDPDGTASEAITDAIAVAAGANHACAIRSGGAVVCWGQNTYRQLGDDVVNHGDATCTSAFVDCTRVPVYAMGLTDAESISANALGDHTCVRTTGGDAECWGRNTERQAADSATTPVATPTVVLTGVTVVSAGASLSCARLAAGATQCWGDNALGQLGRTSTGAPAGPGDVTGLPDGNALAAGGQFACSVRASGPTVCWGSDQLTQLGDGDPVMNSSTPIVVARLP